jgi:hypothetical protein
MPILHLPKVHGVTAKHRCMSNHNEKPLEHRYLPNTAPY